MNEAGKTTTVIVDAMGGDNAPDAVIHGLSDAAELFPVRYVIVGNRDAVLPLCEKYGLSSDKYTLVHTDEVLGMEDDPLAVVRKKKNCSMGIALQHLRDGDGDVMLSAGNTGALHAGSSLLVRPMKGIHRAAIATVLPFTKPTLLLDAGANTNVTAEYLEQWARLGAVYMKYVLGVKSPTVGLLNNGTEQHKGTAVAAEAWQRLSAAEGLNFIGNVEGSDIPYSPADVIVTDGFTGNITLKFAEGMGSFLFGKLKELFGAGARTKIAYLLMKKVLRGFKHEFDASEYGGAPLIGLTKPVIKAHGNSDAGAICAAVRQAVSFAGTDIIPQFEAVAELYRDMPGEEQNMQNISE